MWLISNGEDFAVSGFVVLKLETVRPEVTPAEDDDIAFLAGDRADWHCWYIL
jgi:hypothetical protein